MKLRQLYFLICHLRIFKAWSVGIFLLAHLFYTYSYGQEATLDPLKQWLLWEQTANLPEFQKQTTPVLIPIMSVPSSDVTIDLLNSNDFASRQLFNSIFQGKYTEWFQHPFNTATMVPFHTSQHMGNNTVGFLTSSASIVLRIHGRLLSIKIPTDRPIEPKGLHVDEATNGGFNPIRRYQPIKVDRRDDALSGILRSKFVEEIDQQLPQDKDFQVLKELARVVEKNSGNGYLIRDLSPLEDGKFYLPAHSLPYVGEQMAKALRLTFIEFLIKYYAQPLGTSYAAMVLRYGLKFEEINPQNTLIQLDKNLKPTGKIIVRDLSDTQFVEPIALSNGHKKQLTKDHQLGWTTSKTLSPNSRFLLFLFGNKLNEIAKAEALVEFKNLGYPPEQADIDQIRYKITDTIKRAYQDAFVERIESQLGIEVRSDPKTSISKIQALDELLNTTGGKAQLKRYYESKFVRPSCQTLFGVSR